jgi:ubiquinone biosynthesis protein
MLDQIGPKKLWEELKSQAPHYAKLLPQLPRLLHEYLKQPRQNDVRQMEQLLAEQRRTNRLLQTLIYAGLGFVVSLVVLQVGMHLQLIY